MASRETYSEGSLIERWDSTTGYTRWNAAGAVVEQRSLLAAETAALALADSAVSADRNAVTLRTQISQVIQTFEAADRDWATLTAAQRNDVMKQAVRTIARLARIVNGQLDAT